MNISLFYSPPIVMARPAPSEDLSPQGRSRAGNLPFGLALPLEDLACILLFAFFAVQGAIPGIAPPQAHEITGSVRTAYTTLGGILTQVFANGIVVLLLLRHPRRVLRNLKLVSSVAVLSLLAVASTAWSLDPWLTLRRSLPFALAGLFGIWFATRFSPQQQLAILRRCMVMLAVATVALVVFAPAIGLESTPGHAADWKGVFTQKNACGRMMVLATAAILCDESIPAARLPQLALFFAVLVMSGSRGAWLIEGVVLLLWIVLRIGRRSSARVRVLLAFAAPAGAVAAVAAGALMLPRLMVFLGRDSTLSGRTAIWGQVLQFITHRPLLGYGYDAFWRGVQGPSLQVDAAVHFIVEHAHNGFLEFCLELGLAGLCLFLLSWAAAWRKLWPLWRAGAVDRIGFSMAVLILIAAYDMDENSLLIYNGLFWTLYVAALASVALAARDHRHIGSPRQHAMLMESVVVGLTGTADKQQP